MTRPVYAWHFLANDRRLRYGTRQKVRTGVTIRIEQTPRLCYVGLHGSRLPLDALQYAPGEIVCRVRIGGIIVEDGDKLAGQTRTVMWMADADKTLREFACWVADQALDAAERNGLPVSAASREAVSVARLRIKGKATEEELAAARSAAWSAAWSAADAAARSAYNRKLTAMLTSLHR